MITVDILLLIPIIISFFISLIFLPYWINKAKTIKLVWKDMNKQSDELVAGSGGIIAILGFLIGVLIFIAYRTFIVKSNDYLIEILVIFVSILFLANVGLIDDLLGWRKGGLSKRYRIILIALAAIPLMVINAGKSAISLPFFGLVELGTIYPLILIPIGIVGAATAFNILAGFNGLEAGQGIIIIFALSIVAFITGNSWISVIGLCMIASLIGFMFYNFYPARVFPGNSLTYSIGGLIAAMAIFGNFEKIAVFFLIPYMIEAILKIRGKLIKQSFGKPKSDDGLDLRYNKIYSLNHLAIYLLNKTKFGATEKKAVLLIWTFQIIVIVVGFLLFRKHLFV